VFARCISISTVVKVLSGRGGSLENEEQDEKLIPQIKRSPSIPARIGTEDTDMLGGKLLGVGDRGGILLIGAGSEGMRHHFHLAKEV